MTGPEIQEIYRYHLRELDGTHPSTPFIMNQTQAGTTASILTLAQVISQNQLNAKSWMDDEIEHMRVK